MPSAWSDLDRPPLSAERLRRVLEGSVLWSRLEVVESTGSTNADVAAAARDGAASGLVLLAEEQYGGRGRLDRRWQAPSRSAVLMSMLLRSSASTSELGTLPLLVGVGVAEAVRQVGTVEAVLKWPNDVLVGDRKLGGILLELAGDALVIGVGLNVSVRVDELPVPQATSLLIAGGATDREPLVKEILRAVERRIAPLVTDGDTPSLDAYREICETIGRRVRVELPGGEELVGTAEGIDDRGHVVVRSDDGTVRALAVGDVTHVRGAS